MPGSMLRSKDEAPGCQSSIQEQAQSSRHYPAETWPRSEQLCPPETLVLCPTLRLWLPPRLSAMILADCEPHLQRRSEAMD